MQGSIFRIKNSCCFLHYLKCAEYKLLALVVMKLLLKYAYYIKFYYGKLTIGYVMKQSTGDISFTIGKAISLMDAMGNAVPNIDLYNTILKLVKAKAEDYLGELVSSVFIRIYLLGRYESSDCSLSEDEIYNRIWEFISAGISAGEPVEVKSMVRKRPYPNYITALKPTSKERSL